VIKLANEFIMKWPSLGKQVRFEKIGHNQHIYDWWMEQLPAAAVQSHTIVSGWCISTLVVPTRTLYPCSPETEVLEDISKAPDGRMKLKHHRVFGSTQVLVKYDERSEDLQDITFANAVEADLEELREVGKAVWKAVMQTKEVIRVEFFKAEEA
jgi:hypothetical protein